MNLFYSKSEPVQVTPTTPETVETTPETVETTTETEQENYIKQMEDKIISLENRLEHSWAFVFEKTVKTITNNVIVSVNKFYDDIERSFLY
jgi:hypothetical protein